MRRMQLIELFTVVLNYCDGLLDNQLIEFFIVVLNYCDGL